MQLFFCGNIDGVTAVLDEDETRHCKVLRKVPGDELTLIDGKGGRFSGKLLRYAGRHAEVGITHSSAVERTPGCRVRLGIAATKQNDRIEWMFEKAVETGLDEIFFLKTVRSEKSKVNTERLHRIAVSAIKQSGQFYLPVIGPVMEPDEVRSAGPLLLAHCMEDTAKRNLAEVIRELPANAEEVTLLIGPEGDFTEAERDLLLKKGALTVSLGDKRLRTETAGIYGVVLLRALL